MNKEELEKAIENGESVWVSNKYCYPYEVNLTKNHYIDMADNKESLVLSHLDDVELIDYLEYIFKTEKQALHYHNHANITRTETLPFLTWEEFNKVGKINFYDKNHCYIEFYINRIEKPYMIRIINHGDSYNSWGIKDYDYNEENFYKAYDECVKLFKGVENE